MISPVNAELRTDEQTAFVRDHNGTQLASAPVTARLRHVSKRHDC